MLSAGMCVRGRKGQGEGGALLFPGRTLQRMGRVGGGSSVYLISVILAALWQKRIFILSPRRTQSCLIRWGPKVRFILRDPAYALAAFGFSCRGIC